MLPFDACLSDEVAVDGAMDDAQRRRMQFGMHGKQAVQWYRERQRPLAHGYLPQDVIHQFGCGLGHSSGATRRVDAAPLATERDESVSCTASTTQAQASVGKDSAFEIRLEFIYDELQ